MITADLILQAARQHAAAYTALRSAVAIDDSILGLHARQAVVKAIRSVIFGRRKLVARRHGIARLLHALPVAGVVTPPHAEVLESLEPFATAYAHCIPLDVGALDRATVAQWLDDVLDWAADAARR